VSAEQYRSKSYSRIDPDISSLQDDNPVTYVDWYDAHRYLARLSEYLDRPLVLPTEAQWEFAARGPAVELREVMEAELGAFRPDELVKFVEGRFEHFYTEVGGRIYTNPTEDTFQSLLREATPVYGYRLYATPSGRLTPEKLFTPDMLFYDCSESPTPVDWGPDNAYGLKGMTRGVQEWVEDWYIKRSLQQSIREDPRGPQAGVGKILRGKTWREGSSLQLRLAWRSFNRPDYRDYATGFRVAAPQGT